MLTQQQLEDRKKGLGGSDAAAVIGWSKWKTPYDVWALKTGTRSSEPENDAMRMGNELESFAIEKYEKETGNKVSVPHETFKHKNHKCILANIDGIVSDKNIGVEIKTTRHTPLLNMKNLIENKDWLCQVAHYADVLQLQIYHLFVLDVNTHQTKLYTYNASESFQNALVNKEVKFWNDNVVAKVPPKIMTLSNIKNHFKNASELEAIATDDIEAKIDKLLKIKRLEDDLESKKKELQCDIFLHMCTANKLVSQNGSVLATWNQVSSNRFDVTCFKKEHPEDYEAYCVKTESRRFLPNYKRGN